MTDLMLAHHDGSVAVPPYTREIACGMVAVSLLLLLLWKWAKFAPYRAACVALLFCLMLHGVAAYCQPQHMLDGLVSKILVLLGLLMAVRTGYRRRHSA
jgi:hypothetical protein